MEVVSSIFSLTRLCFTAENLARIPDSDRWVRLLVSEQGTMTVFLRWFRKQRRASSIVTLNGDRDERIRQGEPETNRLPRSSEIRWEGISGALNIEGRFDEFAGRGHRQSVRPWRLKEHSVEQSQEDQLLSEPRRREIFLALVDAQDRKMGVLESRQWIAKRFRVSDRQIRRIESEGLDLQWPPL